MGESTRCPKCNRYGNASLGGFCKDCYVPKIVKERAKIGKSWERYLVFGKREILANVFCDDSGAILAEAHAYGKQATAKTEFEALDMLRDMIRPILESRGYERPNKVAWK